jgi:SAM-dependent MidA family methyltransferase
MDGGSDIIVRTMDPSKPSGLEARLISRIERDGAIPFAEFMEAALYDPEGGYYTSGRDPIGPAGDFMTSPDVHSVFGRMIGRQLIELFESAGAGGPVTLVEMGAGRGNLIGDILEEIRRVNPTLFDRIGAAVIERSPAMVARQREGIAARGLAGKIVWSDRLDSLRPGAGITGCLISNELVDAFPVHRVVMTEEGLKEIYVAVRGGRLAEAIREPSTPELRAYFDRVRVGLVAGQKAEVNLNAVRWMKAVADTFARGFVVTIDYGHAAADLFSPVHMNGTLLCYYRHTVSDTPYRRVGEQDMTAHADFTALALAGREAGLETTGFTDQKHFLLSMGIAEEMEGMDPEGPAFGAMKRLIADAAMGRTFKMLFQHKNLTPPPLRGLSFRPFFKDALFR